MRGRPPTEAQKSAATLLESALQAHDPQLAQDALNAPYRAGLHRIHTSALVALAQAPWHFSHEDVVQALQQLRSPETGQVVVAADVGGQATLLEKPLKHRESVVFSISADPVQRR